MTKPKPINIDAVVNQLRDLYGKYDDKKDLLSDITSSLDTAIDALETTQALITDLDE